MTAKRAVVVLSPFLSVEEAYALGTAAKKLHKDVRLVLGPVPVVGEDDSFPKDGKGQPVKPSKFTIRAEKCPNRAGVEAVLTKLQGSVIPFASVVNESLDVLAFFGGYPNPAWVDAAIPANWKAPALLVVQDLFAS